MAFECDDRQAFPTPEEEKKKPVPLPGFTDRQLRADRGGDRVDDLLRILWSVLGKSDGKVGGLGNCGLSLPGRHRMGVCFKKTEACTDSSVLVFSRHGFLITVSSGVGGYLGRWADSVPQDD